MQLDNLPMKVRPALALACALLSTLAGASGTTAPGYFHKRLAGKIGGKYAITMDLKNVDGELTGQYRYEGKRQGLYLRGKLDPSGSFEVDEMELGAKVTGKFSGKITAGHIEGTWRSADGRRTLPFVADQTSEFVIGSKADILKSAIGVHPLTAISGSGGANAMWDTWKDEGRWGSNVSGISGGMRQGSQISLSKADVALLDSLRIVVGADLSVKLSARGKDLLTVPFRPDGMDYQLAEGHNDVAVEQLKKMSAKTTVHDETLYLLVRDGVDLSKPLSGSFEGLAEGILVVSYAFFDQRFELKFILGSCCDSTTWTFSKSKR